MRLSLAFAAALLCAPATPAPAFAQAPATPQAPATGQAPMSALATTPAPAAGQASPPADPVVATVNGDQIHLSDVTEAAQSLPDEVRSMPSAVLFPMLLDQMVDRHALVIAARAQGLEHDPAVEHAIARANDQVLQNALLSREIAPNVTDAALRTRYEAKIANKPGEEEVHARHILVDSEDKAKAIITELAKGADFAALAKKDSSDPAAANGGDLGWFKATDMVPEFAKAAFALKPGEITQTPVHTQFGWHVIKVDERRSAPVPTFEQSREELRQEVIQEGVRTAVAKAREGLKIAEFNMDGSPAAPASPNAPNPTASPSTDIPPAAGTTPPVPQ